MTLETFQGQKAMFSIMQTYEALPNNSLILKRDFWGSFDPQGLTSTNNMYISERKISFFFCGIKNMGPHWRNLP